MRKFSIMFIVLISLVTIGLAQSPTNFKHPGVFSSQAELDFIKACVTSNNGSPLVAGYQKLAASNKGSLSYTPKPYANVHVLASDIGEEEAAFRNDAHALYIQAIKWVVTGNAAHKDKAIEIANAWAGKFQTIVSEADHPNQGTLEASWALPIWVAGAEILKKYNNGVSGWSSSGFDAFVRKILVYVNGPIASAPNWYISKYLSLMSAGVFLEDASLYNSGYNGVAGQIDAISSSGAIPELTRDFVHSQYVLIGMTQCAEIAHQQGNNGLFTRTGNRLKTGAEAYVKNLMGTGTEDYQSESAWARHSAPYEILLARYTELGISVPNVQNYVLNQNRIEDGVEDHFVGFLSATHSQLPPPVTIIAPSDLAATAISSSQINLTWTDNSANETGFKIERSNDGAAWTNLSTVGANVTTYSNTGLTSSTKYYYRVSAYNSNTSSTFSNVSSAATKNILPNLAAGKIVTASSEPQPENPASALVDDNIATRWSASVYPQWIEVDLGSVKSISQTEVVCYDNRAYQFKIEAKAAATDEYTQIVDRTGNTTPGAADAPISDNFIEINARYVRLTVTGCSVYTGTWVSISEFRVFGSPLINLAVNKSITASSEPQPENPALGAIDNNTATRWSASGYPQWIEVDLGAVYSISKTDLIGYNDRAYQYNVEVKTTLSGTYTRVVDRTANTTPGSITAPISDSFDAVDARYVRLTVTGCSDYTGTWASISEFKVFGTTSSGLSLKKAVIQEALADASVKVVAYVPNWIDIGSFANSIDYSKVTHLNIAFENPDASGNLSFNSANATLIQRAHNAGVKVLVSIGGGSASENATQRARYFNLINSTNRAGFVSKLVSYVTSHNFDGLDVDLEGPAINGDYGAFIAALSTALKAQGKLLTAALSQGYGGDNVPSSTFANFDFINIMAYDATGPWNPNYPGQHSPYSLAVSSFDYWLGRGVSKAKAILGLPFYGYGFGSAFRNDEYPYSEIVNTYAGAENKDQVGSTIYYNGIPTIKSKTTLALQRGGGVMIWQLASDASGAKSLLLAIDQVIKGSPVNNTTIYEAENAVMFQSILETKNGGFHGDAYVNYDNVAGSYVEWTVNSSGAGLVNMAIRFSNAGTANRPMDIYVNGTKVISNLAFNQTGAWTTWTNQTFDVNLNAGNNTIRAIATGAEGGPNVDYLEVNSAVTTLTNLAFQKPVTASSEPQQENPASSAVDENTSTRWSASVYPQWIEVDLGAVYNISRTDVICYGDRAYQFKVEAKATAAGTYTQVVDRTANNTPGTIASPVSDNFGAISARYVKLTVTGCSGYTGTWVSISEFKVFGGVLGGSSELIPSSINAVSKSQPINSPDISSKSSEAGYTPSLMDAVLELQISNYPNPFSQHTDISYTLEKNSQVVITLSDMNGVTKKVLVKAKQNAGNYILPCDFSDLSQGIYLITLKSDDQIKTRKIICVK